MTSGDEAIAKLLDNNSNNKNNNRGSGSRNSDSLPSFVNNDRNNE